MAILSANREHEADESFANARPRVKRDIYCIEGGQVNLLF